MEKLEGAVFFGHSKEVVCILFGDSRINMLFSSLLCNLIRYV